MIDTVFAIKVRMSGLCINRYRLIVRRRLRPLPYRCISSLNSQLIKQVYFFRFRLIITYILFVVSDNLYNMNKHIIEFPGEKCQK